MATRFCGRVGYTKFLRHPFQYCALQHSRAAFGFRSRGDHYAGVVDQLASETERQSSKVLVRCVLSPRDRDTDQHSRLELFGGIKNFYGRPLDSSTRGQHYVWGKDRL